MIQFLCDNSNLSTIYKGNVPNILLIGGFLVSRDTVQEIIEQVRVIKEFYCGDPYAPVKWNLKALKKTYAERDEKKTYDKLMACSNEIRNDIIDTFASKNPVVFISIIDVKAKRKKTVKRIKPNLIGFTFGNLLMRLGLFIERQERKESIEIISDWPEGGDRRPLMREYHSGFKYGRSGNITYNCGSLCSLGFTPSLIFACTECDERIQIADIIVGTVNDFVGYSIGNLALDKYSRLQFSKLFPTFDKGPDKQVIKYGISVSPANGELEKILNQNLDEYVQ